mmetsp:Transcript_5084/g.12742  ORF Transcript_5084/g.12742 Transcript_5084/m.12742 type:complete len:234 (+) Transcript_5084:2964-3665(+)
MSALRTSDALRAKPGGNKDPPGAAARSKCNPVRSTTQSGASITTNKPRPRCRRSARRATANTSSLFSDRATSYKPFASVAVMRAWFGRSCGTKRFLSRPRRLPTLNASQQPSWTSMAQQEDRLPGSTRHRPSLAFACILTSTPHGSLFSTTTGACRTIEGSPPSCFAWAMTQALSKLTATLPSPDMCGRPHLSPWRNRKAPPDSDGGSGVALPSPFPACIDEAAFTETSSKSP